MKDQIRDMAQIDSPSFVNIPNTWSGITAWLIGRFGIGVLGFLAAYMIYTDMKAYHERTIMAYERATIVQGEMRATLELHAKTQGDMKSSLEHHARILERLERAITQK